MEHHERGRMPGPARALGAALVGGLAIALVGGVLGLVAGQIAIAGFTGWLVASALGPRAPGRRARAVAIALAGVAIGLLGLWLIARAQGGVMDPVTYLAQVWGLLVPVELAVAAIAAAITAR
jgi:hypothetical protein